MRKKNAKPSSRKTRVGQFRKNPYTGMWSRQTVKLDPDALAPAADEPAPAARSEIAQNTEALDSAFAGLRAIRDAIGSYRAKVRELEAISARFDALV